MSNFTRLTKHPISGKTEEALWMDDYFGRHVYGVKFNDGRVFREHQIETDHQFSETGADLIRRLRAVIPFQGKSTTAFLCHEAADYIEKLEKSK